jgi:hypothetical protein
VIAHASFCFLKPLLIQTIMNKNIQYNKKRKSEKNKFASLRWPSLGSNNPNDEINIGTQEITI